MRHRAGILGRGALGLAVLLVVSTPAGAAELVALEVDHARSSLVAVTERAGWLRFLGHRHAVLASEWSGDIAVARDLRQGRVQLTIPARALRIDTPDSIARAGLTSRPDDETVGKLQAKMLGPRVLDADRHPTIEFRGEIVDVVDGDRIRVRGPLRIRGRERPVSVDLAVRQPRPGEYRFSGAFQVRQTEFGIEPESIAGVVAVADAVAVHVDVTGIARQP